MKSFEDYVQTANAAKTTTELFEIFKSAMASYGFDKIMFALLTDHNDIGLKGGGGIIQNYPEDWMRHYFENSFDKLDPVVTYGVHQSEAFTWEEIPKQVLLTAAQKKILNMGIESGLNNGVGIPLRGSKNQLAGISLATAEKKDASFYNSDVITAFCNHFYVAFKRLHESKNINPKNIVLTNREREILTWAAKGKTDEEIARILAITRHTVNMHLRNIYSKIDANNRILAVVKALNFGLISF